MEIYIEPGDGCLCRSAFNSSRDVVMVLSLIITRYITSASVLVSDVVRDARLILVE